MGSEALEEKNWCHPTHGSPPKCL
ncbi:hypothetical protein ACHAW6_002227 [Cyclotella cf. meneghiniana]